VGAGVDRPVVVLLVDDDPGDVLMIEEALATIGIPRIVHVARDGGEAVEFLRKQGEYADAPRPDFVLLDLNMPRMDGRQVLAEVKADVDLRQIPVVVLTTSRSPDDVLASYGLYANAYVTKPMSLDDLTDTVQRIDDFLTRTAILPKRGD
jgi:CheY-like chemotaxis protein